VWHVSVSPRFSPISLAVLWKIADHELRGVGDAALGEWREVGDLAVHLRRRLTPAEMRAGGIATVWDVRGTVEHALRIEKMLPHLPPAMRTLPLNSFP
jgi:hypothetical protein